MDAFSSTPIRILGIGGSTRRGSLSLALLKATLGLAEEAGARTVLADVRELNLPMYDDDRPLAEYPATLRWLMDEVRAADAYLLCSPTYHGTVAGGVKNALDALNFLWDADPPYFGGKVVGLLALGGAGATNVINSLHHATRAMNGLTSPTAAIIGESALDPERGTLRDENAERRLRQLATEIVALTHRLQHAPIPIA
jgi:FMN reductase